MKNFLILILIILLLIGIYFFVFPKLGDFLFKKGKGELKVDNLFFTSPKLGDFYFEKGQNALRVNNNFLAAEEFFRKAISFNKNNFNYYLGLAEALLYQNKFNEVKKLLTNLKEQAKNNKDVLREIGILEGNLLYRENDLENSKKIFEELYKENSQSAEINWKLGLIEYEKGNYKEAEKYILEAIVLSPKNPAYINSLGTVWIAMGKYEDARNEFLKALKLNPSPYYQAVIYNNLADLSLKLKDYNNALDYINKALNATPYEIAILYLTRAEIYENLNENQKAISDYRKALEILKTKTPPLYQKYISEVESRIQKLLTK